MNPTRPTTSQVAEDQAALWAAKLDGNSLTTDDRVALEAWMAANPEHRVLLSQYCQFSADLEEQLAALVAAGALSMPVATAKPRFNLFRAVWIGTALATAAIIAVGVWIARPRQQIESFATVVAQRKTLKLSDGSVVELNARTNLLVELTAGERHVRMPDGEAFFTVAKDKSRPFVVETPAGSVRVTGTVFNVRTETTSDFQVSVVEGSVQVSPCRLPGRESAPVALTANEQLSADAQAVTKRPLKEDELDDVLAWRRGYAVFDRTPLSRAVAKFARYHGQAITVAPALNEKHVSGQYSLDDLKGFLAAIEAALPVQVSHETSGAYHVAPRSGS